MLPNNKVFFSNWIENVVKLAEEKVRNQATECKIKRHRANM